PSARPPQMRYVAFGELNGRVALVVLTYNGIRRRLISARYSTKDEKARYEAAGKSKDRPKR
ncbi:MAG: BrnT family toxin, partial [Chthoniobacterales bacterium]